MVPLASIATFSKSVEPSERLQFQQLNAIVIEGVAAQNVAMGTAIEYLKSSSKRLLPEQASYDYAGESRRYVQQSTALVTTFFVALMVIYLVLAAQFESWRDPFIILISVPINRRSTCVYGYRCSFFQAPFSSRADCQLVAKNGILIVEFAID